ncbi:MAG: nickel-dependent lactate racemase [Planctomycetota bacterium]|nr:nickel-dependent lactate racemase [Planctomycetota bacterium]
MKGGPLASDYQIGFGASSHRFRLPVAQPLRLIQPPVVDCRLSPEQVIRRALEQPIGCPPLHKLARGARTAAILVPGKDRVAGVAFCLPLILQELNSAGIPDERIEVILATGTHAKHTPQEVAGVLGQQATSRLRWREHDCGPAGEFNLLGATSRGTQVALAKAVVEADLRILTGRIIPHYFAGFGGGRKALLPGVAAFETILQNHRLTLAPEGGIHRRMRPCSLEGNPVHLDMVEAARMAGTTFVLNTLLDWEDRLVHAVAGELEVAHLAGCTEAERLLKVVLPEPLDAVICSAGGAPYDCNFTQALKAVLDVQEVVRPGGAILWVASCPEGMKKQFLHWAAIESDEQLKVAVQAKYDLAGHNSILLRSALRKARIALWSGLPEEQVRCLGLEPMQSLEQGLEWLRRNCPAGACCGFASRANVIYATAAGGLPA